MTTIILGGSLDGIQTALEIKQRKGDREEVLLISEATVVNVHPKFNGIPVDWIELEDIEIPIQTVLEQADIQYVHARTVCVEPENHRVLTTKGPFDFDHILIAAEPNEDRHYTKCANVTACELMADHWPLMMD